MIINTALHDGETVLAEMSGSGCVIRSFTPTEIGGERVYHALIQQCIASEGKGIQIDESVLKIYAEGLKVSESIQALIERMGKFTEYKKQRKSKMSDQYILEGHTPVACDDLTSWAMQFESADRAVAKTKIGEVKISTVFLGLDPSFGGGDPLLFETIVFGGELDGEQDRYSTWEEAEAGHHAMVDKVKKKH